MNKNPAGLRAQDVIGKTLTSKLSVDHQKFSIDNNKQILESALDKQTCAC